LVADGLFAGSEFFHLLPDTRPSPTIDSQSRIWQFSILELLACRFNLLASAPEVHRLKDGVALPADATPKGRLTLGYCTETPLPPQSTYAFARH
jgi:hypothetical protein